MKAQTALRKNFVEGHAGKDWPSWSQCKVTCYSYHTVITYEIQKRSNLFDSAESANAFFDDEHRRERDRFSKSVRLGRISDRPTGQKREWKRDDIVDETAFDDADVADSLPAQSQIKNRQLKWVSAAVWFNGKDPVSGQSIGPVLTSVAFTNQPFLKGLQPLAASSRQESRTMSKTIATQTQKAAFIMSAARTYRVQGFSHEEAHAKRATTRRPRSSSVRCRLRLGSKPLTARRFALVSSSTSLAS